MCGREALAVEVPPRVNHSHDVIPVAGTHGNDEVELIDTHESGRQSNKEGFYLCIIDIERHSKGAAGQYVGERSERRKRSCCSGRDWRIGPGEIRGIDDQSLSGLCPSIPGYP